MKPRRVQAIREFDRSLEPAFNDADWRAGDE